MKGFLLTSIALLTAVLSACSTTKSDNVDTAGIYAVFAVSEDGANARGDATFYVGGTTGTVLQLSAGDSITCNGNTMSENQDLFGKYYYYSGCGTLTAGATYTLVFTRNGDDGVETYSSSVVMPAAVTVTSPSGGASYTRGQTIPVTWNSGSVADTIEVAISGSGSSASGSGSTTYSRSQGSLDDDGAYTILGADTDPADTITGVISNVKISVTRTHSGSMGSGLTGQISARRAGAVSNLTLNP